MYGNFDDAKRMVDEAINELGSVDVLVNNAGITNDKLMLKMSEADFEDLCLKLNLTGAFNMTQSVLKPMTCSSRCYRAYQVLLV